MEPTWEQIAKALPYGASRKVVHCGANAAASAYNNNRGISLHCFRCGGRTFIPHGPRSAAEVLAAREAAQELKEAREVPARAIHLTDADCPSEALLWLLRTGLSPEEASDVYGMRFDPVTRRVLIPITGGFLARAVFNERPKYITAGTGACGSYDLIRNPQSTLVVTEDILSAIKVYRAGFNAMSILGTSVSAVLAARIGRFKDIICWTDGDKAGDNAFIKLRKRLGLYDVALRRIRTTEDPKVLHISDIQTIIAEST